MYNSAAARCPTQSGWSQRAFDIQKSYWGKWSITSLEAHTKVVSNLKQQLQDVRKKFDKQLNKVNAEGINSSPDGKDIFINTVQNVSLDCSNDMICFTKEIMRESMRLLKKPPPCDFSMLAIGSLARGEATPYSDLECLFLIERRNPEIEEYFERLAVTSYFLIGNLGETTLKYMNIEELNGWFKDCAMSGFKIDGLQEEAGNIPTGNGQPGTANRFIVTAEELAETHKRILNNPDHENALRGDLTAMLRFTKTIYNHGKSSSKIYNKFLSLVRQQSLCDKREQVNMEMLRADTTKFNFTPNEDVNDRGFTVDVKKELYRFPSILLLDLSIVLQCAEENSWMTADKLLTDGHISNYLHKSLKFMLACACYIRLSAYLYHDSHNDNVSVAPKSVTLQEEADQDSVNKHHRKWFI